MFNTSMFYNKWFPKLYFPSTGVSLLVDYLRVEFLIIKYRFSRMVGNAIAITS